LHHFWVFVIRIDQSLANVLLWIFWIFAENVSVWVKSNLSNILRWNLELVELNTKKQNVNNIGLDLLFYCVQNGTAFNRCWDKKSTK
jgi:hypothetical protein